MILTPDEESVQGAVRKVKEIAAEDPRVFVPQQFENPDNPRCHYENTAHELWRQIRGEVDCFIAGVGSGGTLQGVGTFLKEHKPNAKVVAVEPKNVSALLGHEPGLHQIQGIGDGFIPAVLDISLVDDVIEVSDEDAIETTRQLGRDLGLLVGISSGANVWAARELIARGFEGKIVTVLADRAERYFQHGAALSYEDSRWRARAASDRTRGSSSAVRGKGLQRRGGATAEEAEGSGGIPPHAGIGVAEPANKLGDKRIVNRDHFETPDAEPGGAKSSTSMYRRRTSPVFSPARFLLAVRFRRRPRFRPGRPAAANRRPWRCGRRRRAPGRKRRQTTHLRR